MATQIIYKNNQLASFSNETQILKTAGKYMEDDITVSSTNDLAVVGIIDETDVAGGTIRHINAISFEDDTIVMSGEPNLLAQNIKAGTTVFGVSGSYTSDATATATDIVSNKSAYVNGFKVIGSLVTQHYYTGSSVPSSSLGENGDIYLRTNQGAN